MNPKIEKLKEKIKELERMEEISIEDIETEPPTPLDREIIEKSQEIWQEVLEICKKEKIKDTKIFDKKYNIFQYGLENFIEEYSAFIDYCGQMDEIYLKPEIKMLKEALEHFNINKQTRQEFELLIIRDTYIIGEKEEAKKQVEEWIKRNPNVGEGYEIKCDWELEKSKPDMEKIARILDDAVENGTFVPNEEIYEEVIKYYKKLGDKKLAEHYKLLLNLEQVNFEQENYYEEDMEEYEEVLDEEMEKIIEDIKYIATDKVEKNKTFEEYFGARSNEEQIKFLFPQLIMYTKKEAEVIIKQKDIKKYILENYDTILKEKLKYFPKDLIKFIKKLPIDGFVEMELDIKSIQVMAAVHKYFMLGAIGIVFMEYKNDKLLISIPNIKKIKEYLKDKNLIKENNHINEKMAIISGMCEVYGAFELDKIYPILEKFYKGITKEKLANYLLIFCEFFQIANIKTEKTSGKVQFIYNNLIDEKIAKKILSKKKRIKNYSKEEYIKYSNLKYIKNTKGYKKIEKVLNSDILLDEDLLKMLDEILIAYVMGKHLDDKKVDDLLEVLILRLEEIDKLGFQTLNIEAIKEGLKELAYEIPKW